MFSGWKFNPKLQIFSSHCSDVWWNKFGFLSIIPSYLEVFRAPHLVLPICPYKSNSVKKAGLRDSSYPKLLSEIIWLNQNPSLSAVSTIS